MQTAEARRAAEAIEAELSAAASAPFPGLSLSPPVGGNLNLSSEEYTETVYNFLNEKISISEFLGENEEIECEPCLQANMDHFTADAYEPEEQW